MDTKATLDLKNQVVTKYGPWDSNNVYLEAGLYTMGSEIVGDEIKLQRVVQCVLDHTGGTVEGMRVLDLGCGEGLYAIEFARRKASCLAIEGREPRAEKVRFVKRSYLLIAWKWRRTTSESQRQKIREVRRRSVSGDPVPLGSAGRVLFCSEAWRGLPKGLHCRYKG